MAVERLPGQSTWGPKRHGKPGGWWGGGERMENEYVVPWDRGVDRFLGGEDVMSYTVREHEALVGLGEVRCSMGGGW